MKTAAAIVGAGVLAAGALVAGGTVADLTPAEPETFVGPGVAELAPGQYVGPCSIVTPPEPDPCEAAQLAIRYQFFAALVNAEPYKRWAKGAPGDVSRLAAQYAAPRCSTPANPQPQTMKTRLGEAIGNAVEAYACALGTEPIVLPAPDPPPTGTDRSAPTAPGPITVAPGG